MAVVDGLASTWGAIFGTAAVTLIGDALHGFDELDIIAFGLILMIIMIFMPRGIWVHFHSWIKQRQRRPAEDVRS